ncbi:Fructose-1-phosphate phosphatase YqaB [Planctomycetes bacterium K23_9]|uniref:Fructose-1-phosphate phosphatase YqaB n=2 Tax=Stieleria marina TaxID=1930275 RepID=A0A517NM37_9BACT|nr:Fructose-1-phosphate phosphatase YqaB [Planctomycetes bacterium K23_9]
MPAHYAGWRDALSQQGMTLAEETFFAHCGTPSRILIPRLAAESDIQIDYAKALDAKETFFLQSIDLLQAIDPIVQIASENRGKFPMAVASGGTRRLVQLQLQQINIIDWFDHVVTSEDTEKGKPDPDIFLEAAKRLGVAPNACQVYEDGEPGIEAARRAGMSCIDIRKLI